MPPKKKKGNSKSGKNAKSADRDSASSDNHTAVMDELNTEYFLLHIQDLERRYKRYEEKLKRLETANKGLLDKHTSVSRDKKESIRFLQVTLENKRDELADLQDRLEGLQQTKDAEKDMYEARLQKLRTELQEMKDQLTSENNILAAKLAALEEFKRQKDSLLERYALLEQQRDDLIHNQELNVDSANNKTLLDRDRLKKEMVQRVNQVASEFRKVSNKQMADTTKRLIRENVSIQTQLMKMTDKVADLVEENEEIRARTRKEAKEIRRLERDSENYAKKSSCHHKIIHMLNLKREDQMTQIQMYEEEEKLALDAEEKNAEMRQEILETKTRVENLREDITSATKEFESHRKEIDSCNENIQESKMQLMETIIALRDILQHNPLLPRVSSTSMSFDGRHSSGTWMSVSEMDPTATAEKLLNRLINSLCSQENTTETRPSSETSSITDKYSNSSIGRSVSLPPSRAATRKGPLDGRREKVVLSIPTGQNRPIDTSENSVGMMSSDYMIKRAAKGYCVPGNLQLVPNSSIAIPTQVEKNQMRFNERDKLPHTKREQQLWAHLTEGVPRQRFTSSVSSSKDVGVQTSSVVKAAAMATMKQHLVEELS